VHPQARLLRLEPIEKINFPLAMRAALRPEKVGVNPLLRLRQRGKRQQRKNQRRKSSRDHHTASR
jgi:hypothetical protein